MTVPTSTTRKATPHEMDGFVTQVDGGYEAAAGGAVLGVKRDATTAVRAAQDAAGDRPTWYVHKDGTATPARIA